ncbi:MAG TPA: acyl-CoA dehydrogenase family protein, partial [Ilumatobacter sp.]|nr:acyl-CoA dehydrogenase family protein [Ilumatobacter sp.]
MQFALSDEQLLLRDTARSFVAKHCPPALAKEWDETNHFPVDLWNKMAELGWFALPFPVEDGGGGGT